MNVLLKSLTWMKGNELVTGDLRIHRGKIQQIAPSLIAKKKERTISFDNYYLYPGLINGHDHLEMNLYPQIGSPPYQNYTQWAKDVYKPNESPVQEIESIPLKDRLLWGGIKNLISGVTTVIHHNPWYRMLGRDDFPVKVLKKYRWAHSLAFDKMVFRNFSSRSTLPFIIHAAEGIDALAHNEIRQLNEMGVLKKNTVLIHGIGLSKTDIRLIQEAQASVVWCPSSNFFMFGQTADVLELKKGVKIALGSDSTMTGPPSLLAEMRVAAKTGQVSPREVFNMVTDVPAQIFNIPIRGIEEGEEADLLIVPISKADYYENLLDQQSQHLTAVFVKGEFLYGDSALGAELNPQLHQWQFGKSSKGIAFDLAALKRNILKKTNARHLEGNLLWQLVAGD
jgi:cytosine/adenosine deaminase-related metal-dependent hydrolase